MIKTGDLITLDINHRTVSAIVVETGREKISGPKTGVTVASVDVLWAVTIAEPVRELVKVAAHLVTVPGPVPAAGEFAVCDAYYRLRTQTGARRAPPASELEQVLCKYLGAFKVVLPRGLAVLALTKKLSPQEFQRALNFTSNSRAVGQWGSTVPAPAGEWGGRMFRLNLQHRDACFSVTYYPDSLGGHVSISER